MTRYTLQYARCTENVNAYLAESVTSGGEEYYPPTDIFRCIRCTLEWAQGTDQGDECPVCDHCYTCNDTRRVDYGEDGMQNCPECTMTEPPEFPVYIGTDGREHAEF